MHKKRNIIRLKDAFIWGGTHPFFYHPFISYFTPDLKNKVILDCGCGKGINGYLIRTTRDLGNGKLIGLDANSNYIKFCNQHRVYDRTVKHYLPTLPFKDKSIDFLICTEVIEHLSKKEGEILLKEIDRVCKGRAIITTPNIYFNTTPGEYEDAHHSLWSSSDFRRFDYRVYGLGFKVAILQNDPLIKIKQALYCLFTPISFFLPQLGGMLICVKDFNELI